MWLDLTKAGFYTQHIVNHHIKAVHINKTVQVLVLNIITQAEFAVASQMSTSARVVFKWIYLFSTSRKPTTQLTGDISHGFSCFVWCVSWKWH